MKYFTHAMRLWLASLTIVLNGLAVAEQSTYESIADYLTPAQKLGRDIWYKATAGNARHHTYVLGQRFGAPIDFYRVLGSAFRDERFSTWGLINHPDCKPATPDSFGFDVCPGDEELLKYVGKEGYKDPACDIQDDASREDSCHLAFGTSTGAMGFRKFPNPRFKADRWPGWKDWNPGDASIEPPFLIGTTCGSCHISFNPKQPPQDPNHPQWDNILGAVGNAYTHMQEIFLSGLKPDHITFQTLAHVRPGTTDTSAVSHDQVHNTGTMNAIINFHRRPQFTHDISRWRRDDQGEWQYETKSEKVFHILKGGGDSVGADLALQRVFVNIGVCSEECWVNHLTRVEAFSGWNSEQTPFDIAQCRKDCKYWRAVEDRIPDLIDFLLTRRPTDLKDAKEQGNNIGADHLAAVQTKYNNEYTEEGGVFEAGRQVFAKNCARCHSSQEPELPGQPKDEQFFLSLDYLAIDESGDRIDWLGNDERIEAPEIGTNRCRSLHSNHMRDHIWEQFASDTYHVWPNPSGVPELENEKAGGRGYYRNISLLSVWAHAPFMHNNAVGPESCSKHYTEEWTCLEKDPSIDGRIKMYEASMDMLLNPEKRPKKISKTSEDIGFNAAELGIRLPVDFKFVIPKGTPAMLLGSLNVKNMVNAHIDQLKTELDAAASPIKKIELLRNHFGPLLSDQKRLIEELSKYSNCLDLEENKGHTFGAELTDREKTALVQYMKQF